MEIVQMFKQIEEYQKKLGYDFNSMTFDERIECLRYQILALNQEVAELANSFPWKPWRSIEDQGYHPMNAMEEIVDCLFFLGAILSIIGTQSETIETMFTHKLLENYSRIDRGYNNKPEKRR